MHSLQALVLFDFIIIFQFYYYYYTFVLVTLHALITNASGDFTWDSEKLKTQNMQ